MWLLCGNTMISLLQAIANICDHKLRITLKWIHEVTVRLYEDEEQFAPWLSIHYERSAFLSSLGGAKSSCPTLHCLLSLSSFSPSLQPHQPPCCSLDMSGTLCLRALALAVPTAGILFVHLSGCLTLSFPSDLCSNVPFSMTLLLPTLYKWPACLLPLTSSIFALLYFCLLSQHLALVKYQIICLLDIFACLSWMGVRGEKQGS